MKDWYRKYRDRIREAKTDKEINQIIDSIFEEGFESGKDNCDLIEREHEDYRMDLD